MQDPDNKMQLLSRAIASLTYDSLIGQHGELLTEDKVTYLFYKMNRF